MLDNNLKEQVRSIFADLVSQYTFEIEVSNTHPSKDELLDLISDVTYCSDKLSYNIKDGKELLFTILKDNEASSVIFRAVPNGHEFSTLLLAILNLDGKGKNLPDETLIKRIKSLEGNINISSYISLSCTNCPDVVQALNIFSFINPNIKHEIVDGAIYKDEVDSKNIQAVPSVWVNNELFHVGRGSVADLLMKLEDKFGSNVSNSNDTPVRKEYDVIVLGGGPAGTSAAIYSARKGLSVALVAERIGGQVLDTVAIENIISVPKTTGTQLVSDLKRHAADYSIDILENRKAIQININDEKKEIKTSLNEILSAPAVIVATGASWRRLNVPGEAEHIGSGIAFCTHCDGPFYKNKRVVVVGGGNSGLEAAIDLAAIATQVTVLEYGETLRGDSVLQEKLNSLSNVTVKNNAATQEVLGSNGKVTGISYLDRNSKTEHTIDTDGIFIQIGLSANSELIKDIVSTTPNGEIVIDANCRTDIPGVYAAGDVTTVPFKQIVIAMGEGAKAALSAFEDRLKNRLN